MLPEKEDIYGEKERLNNGEIEEKPLCYKNVKEPSVYTEENLSYHEIAIITGIEAQAYREEQRLLDYGIEDIKEIEYIYGIKKAKIVIGSNKDWYLIYGENDEGDIEVSDFAIVGAMNSEKSTSESQGNVKLAIAESTDILYKILIEAGENGQYVHCDATKDTSLINITRMLEKGLIKIYDDDENEIIYDKEKGLVYADDGEEIEYEDFLGEEDIEMLGVNMNPNVEPIKKEREKIQKLLDKVRAAEIYRGQKKGKGIDELKNTIRKKDNDDDAR